MNQEVLFTITRDNLDTGLRGYPVGYCTTSAVDPVKGLFYVGRPIRDLAYKEPEEVIYLLWNGKEATKDELTRFKKELQSRGQVSKRVLEQIKNLPREGHPMKLFAASLLIEGMLEGKSDYREDCLNLVARIPTLVAALINHHAGWRGDFTSKPELGYIENFVSMLNVPNKREGDLISVMKLFNILHYDHGGGNLSTFVGKAVASGLEDVYGSMSSSICALSGPRHGKANQDCLEFVEGVLKEVGEEAKEEQIEGLLRTKLAKGELVFGFGHAVLRVEDARATIFYEVAESRFASYPLVKIAKLLRKAGPKVLGENPKISNPYPNVDAISGVVIQAAGFTYPDYIAVLFGMSRVVGIARQIIYERCEARSGKGTPIVRPKYLYAGDESLSG
jgi:citrate synthase